MQENIETVLCQEDESAIDGMNAQLDSLQKELLKRLHGKIEHEDIAHEINRPEELKKNALAESTHR
ncbi:hypothetical protein [Anaerotignum sp.]|uniref:hypothetical protein n=1 Tax=Anaerotignum sp. TaxID=2039241 RepID=UPI0028AB0331|nr:hypothetical protein [Anaerotignum sp.]